jgi:hypothetical protein
VAGILEDSRPIPLVSRRRKWLSDFVQLPKRLARAAARCTRVGEFHFSHMGRWRCVLSAVLTPLAFPILLLPQTPLATVNVNTLELEKTIPQDFVGISLEVSTGGQGLAVPPANMQMGKPSLPAAQYVYSLGEPGSPNTAFFEFMRNLGEGVLRLGGNSQDNTCWDADAAPHPDWCKAKLLPGDLKLFSLAASESGWKLIVGINLKQDSAAWARREVTEGIAQDIRPGQILGLEFGNEPDLFARDGSRPEPFTPGSDARDFLAYVKAFREDPASRSYAVIGPATCCMWRNPMDLGTFIDGVGPSNLKLVTVHDYSTTTCGNRTVTVAQLLSPELMSQFNRAAEGLVGEAHRRDLPIALAETNSASCGGMKGVSNAFASTVWGLDWLFSSAQDGFTNVNFHISFRTGGSAYNPIDTVGWQDASHQWHFENTAEPLYDAMYLFARNASGKHLLNARVKSDSNIKAFAVSTCSGCAVKVFVINKDLAAAGTVHVHLPGPMGEASLLLLQAPSLESLAPQVRYGGVQFDANGNLPSPHVTDIKPDAGDDYDFTLPNSSVAMLTVEPGEGGK